MGDGIYHDFKNQLAQKNAEIDRLNAVVLVHTSRTSNLQTRLLQTLDVLDETQRSHATELRELEHKYARLERRMEKHRNACITLEEEKDDLKDSVLELIEKIEQSNDIRSWPFNRFQISDVSEYIPIAEPRSHPLNEEEQLAYAGTIIDRLRRERDDERAAHSRTRDSLQSRVDMLEAQLARREAELEFYATHSTCVPAVLSGRNDVNIESKVGSSSKAAPARSNPLALEAQPRESRNATHSPSGQSFTNEAIINMLNTTAARNRALEVEIKTLFKRLHQARSILSSPTGASVATVSPHPHARNDVPVPQPHPSDPLPSSPKDDMIPYGINDYRITDGGDSARDGIVDGDDDQIPYDQQRRTRTSYSQGPSCTGVNFSPLGKALYDDRRSNRHHYKAKRPRKSSAQGEAHEDSVNRLQGLGTSNLLFQSSTSPVSDTIDGHQTVHDDNVDAVRRMTTLAIGSSIGSNIGSASLTQEHVSFVHGSGTPEEEEEAIDVSDVNSADSLDPQAAAAGLRRLRPRSATFDGLNVEIQELSFQIDAFRHEREKLSKFVANRQQTANRAQTEGYVFPSEVMDEDDASLQVENVFKDQNQTVIHGDDQKGVQNSEGARTNMLDVLTQRLSIVEHECLELRHELNECRVSSSREIQVLRRRVSELSLLCNAPSSPKLAAFRSDEGGDVEPILEGTSADGYRRVQDPHAFDTLPILSPARGFIVDNNHEDDLEESRLQFENQIPDGGESYGGLEVPGVESYVEIVDDSPLVVMTTSPHLLGDTQGPWLRLDDADFDGLLDAIEGETSMELATPLLPSTLLERISPASSSPASSSPASSSSSSSDSTPGAEHENRDEQSDRDSGPQEVILDDLQDLVGVEFGGGGEEEEEEERGVLDEQGRRHIYCDDDRREFEVDGEGEGGRERQFLDVGDMGGVCGMAAPESAGGGVDDVDVDVGATNRDDLHEALLSTPLLLEGKPEDEFDDDGGGGDGGGGGGYGWSGGESVGVNLDNGDEHHQEDRDETVLVIPQSQSQS